MDATMLRALFLDYYREKQHTVIGNAPLIPEHDPSVLFTTAGMHPLVPYLLGEPHPAGRRLADCQICLRTDDIMEVGDGVHLTFFEMLGNWSLGNYWKPEAIRMSLEFLTERLGLEADRLRVTCFAGDGDAPRDAEAADVWRSLGVPAEHITYLPKADNWWGPAGITGPCGPDTEMFYDMGPDGPRDETPSSNPARFWEIWNDVFMQYDKEADGTFRPLAQCNIDTGLGLERTLAILEGAPTLYSTELFVPIVDRVLSIAQTPNPFAVRVISDHTRAAVFVLAEGVRPGNVDQPYIVRRLIRRAVRYGREAGAKGAFLSRVAEAVLPTLSDVYPELELQRDPILSALEEEEGRFERTLQRGEREFARALQAARDQGQRRLEGNAVFRLYDTYGFPPELTAEMAEQEHVAVDMAGFRKAFEEHQSRSRLGAAARFRGGLSERSPETTKLHTATHLLHQALRRALGPHVEQRGSNITVERLRFDFSHQGKLSEDQLAEVERIVNEQIVKGVDITYEEMTVEGARRLGAIGLFGERYGDRVRVYSVEGFSKEICGGPHVENTRELGRFRIVKEEAVAAGIRRIRAVLDHQR
jgi:alanyl-tRNA synthetase